MTVRNIYKEVSMGFTRDLYPAGTHMCLIYSDDQERRKLISKFLKSGLSAGEKVAYFADTMTPEEVQNWFVNMGVNIPHNGNTEQFSIQAALNTYCPNGKFVPGDMLDTLRAYYQQAIKEEYSGVRVSGEMSWALKGIPGSERLMEYEAMVNDVLVTHPITAICQYDANCFDGATILDVLRVHPMMIVQEQIVRNYYYMKPEDFINDYTGAK